MNISTVETTTSRDNVITTMPEESRGMVRNIARKYGYDIEDCMQDAALAMLEAWDRIPATCTNVKAYLHRCIRNKIIDYRKRALDEMSIDAPMPKRTQSYADTLAAPTTRTCEQEAHVDHIIETIHSALRVCMLEEQEYAIHLYGMHAFTPVAPAHRRPGLKAVRDITDKRDACNIKRSILNVLRNHPQVQGLIQRETCVL